MIIRIEYLINGFKGKKTFDSTSWCSKWIKGCKDMKITSIKYSER